MYIYTALTAIGLLGAALFSGSGLEAARHRPRIRRCDSAALEAALASDSTRLHRAEIVPSDQGASEGTVLTKYSDDTKLRILSRASFGELGAQFETVFVADSASFVLIEESVLYDEPLSVSPTARPSRRRLRVIYVCDGTPVLPPSNRAIGDQVDEWRLLVERLLRRQDAK